MFEDFDLDNSPRFSGHLSRWFLETLLGGPQHKALERANVSLVRAMYCMPPSSNTTNSSSVQEALLQPQRTNHDKNYVQWIGLSAKNLHRKPGFLHPNWLSFPASMFPETNSENHEWKTALMSISVLWVKNMSTWSLFKMAVMTMWISVWQRQVIMPRLSTQFCYPAVISSYQLSKRVDPTPSLKKEKENMKM